MEGSGFVLATSYPTWSHLCLPSCELDTSTNLLSVGYVQLAALLLALAVLQLNQRPSNVIFEQYFRSRPCGWQLGNGKVKKTQASTELLLLNSWQAQLVCSAFKCRQGPMSTCSQSADLCPVFHWSKRTRCGCRKRNLKIPEWKSICLYVCF